MNAAQGLPTLLQNGTSWTLAYKSLQTALLNASAGDEIWVAGGSYQPTTTGSQTASFTPPDGVRVLGGFQVGDLSEADRDPIANITLLTGEIGAAGIADNSLHVVRATGVSGTILDGFIIANGNADNTGIDASGGALLVDGPAGQTDLEFRRCTFVSNDAVAAGGAASVTVGGVRFVDCVFRNNQSNNGGAIDVANGAVVLANCRIIDNSATLAGGVRLTNADGSVIQNCVIAGNDASGVAGAMQITASDTLVTNCTIVHNTGTASTGGVRLDGSMIGTFRNTIIFGNTAGAVTVQVVAVNGASFQRFHCDIQGAATDGNGNFSADPMFVDADGQDGVLGTIDDDLRLRNGSPCVDRGETSIFNPDVGDVDEDGSDVEALPLDLDGHPRRIDDLVQDQGEGSQTFLDIGAYELDRPGTTLCVDASAPAGGDGTTWAKAFTSLQSALALSNGSTLEQPVAIWIANGTYRPTTDTDRSKTFSITAPVSIYGGFGGGEGSITQRFPQVNATVLSGNIGSSATSTDNSFHVVTAVLNDESAVIDGVFINDGNSIGGPPPLAGGGVLFSGANGGTLTVRNARLFANRSASGAGASVSGTGTATFLNCHIAGNVADAGGGGLVAGGGGVQLNVIGCTILGNSANVGGGVMAQATSTAAVRNSIVYFNVDAVSNGEREQVATDATAVMTLGHCCVQCLGAGPSLPGSENCTAGDPRLVEPAGGDGVFGTSDDVILLRSFSPCIDAGVTSVLPLDPEDLDQDGVLIEQFPFDISLQGKRLVDDTAVVNGPAGFVDIGASERQSASFGALPNAADLDGDGLVGPADLAMLLGFFGSSGPAGDLDGSCSVGSADLAVLLGAWSP